MKTLNKTLNKTLIAAAIATWSMTANAGWASNFVEKIAESAPNDNADVYFVVMNQATGESANCVKPIVDYTSIENSIADLQDKYGIENVTVKGMLEGKWKMAGMDIETKEGRIGLLTIQAPLLGTQKQCTSLAKSFIQAAITERSK